MIYMYSLFSFSLTENIEIPNLNNYDILLSVFKSSDIKLLTKSGEIKPFLSVFILECPVYVHLKSPSHPTTTTLPVSGDVLSTTTMSLLLFVVILSGKVNSLCIY
jgi:hypothetical protein